MSTTLDPQHDSPVVAERPRPGAPRPYEFPAVVTERLSNGLTIQIADLPGRPLISASLVIRGGAAGEPAAYAGSTVLAARALRERRRSEHQCRQQQQKSFHIPPQDAFLPFLTRSRIRLKSAIGVGCSISVSSNGSMFAASRAVR